MAEVIELQKLKLAELRQECEARGLETKGNKGELIARLQAYLDEHVTTKAPETTSAEEAAKKLVKIEAPPSAGEKLLKRAERFNMPATAESKKAQRAARFGLPADAKSPAAGSVATGKTAVSFLNVFPVKSFANVYFIYSFLDNVYSFFQVNVDQLKKRAERFGVNVSSISQKIEEDEKLKKRKERFGILTGSAAASPDVEAKKVKRAERFGMA
ncbi:hypothetical protein WMY93_014292 [Mugilogobius chulae]|uniref:SAP domain-containing ribonucleoprotein n=1 Tax=Mugilogobius chulae TaxID=88201 RepID=A0AAW0NYT2_9GOBI